MLTHIKEDEPLPVLNEADAARYIGVSLSFLRQARYRRLISNQQLPPPIIRVGRRILYRRCDLDAWLSALSTD